MAAVACFAVIATTALADQTISYSVQPGDSVDGLAGQFGVSPNYIATSNGLSDPNVLAVGQRLLISIPSGAGPFGIMAPDRRADLVGYDPGVLAFDQNLSVATPSPTGPFGAITPDRRDQTDPNANVGPAANATASLLKDTSTDVSPGRVATVQPAATATPAPSVAAAPSPPKTSAILSAPYHSQFDGSIWAETNCGPTSLSMALGALGVKADQITLRSLADKQMGFSNPDDGTTWESLAYAAKASGTSNEGLYNGSGKGYRSWSIDDLKNELAKGHPVILLVHYKSLPDHAASAFYGDHYIVGLGFDANGNLVYDDPAFKTLPGSDRTIDPAHLQTAWSKTAAGLTRTALALYR